MEYEARGEKNKQGKQNSANSHDVFVCFSKQQQQHKQEQQRMCMILCFCDAQLPCKLLLSSATHAGSAENCVSGWGGAEQNKEGKQNSANSHNVFVCFSNQQLQHKGGQQRVCMVLCFLFCSAVLQPAAEQCLPSRHC